jgi:transposase
MTQSSVITAGVDTGKDKLDIAIHGQPGGSIVQNGPSGWIRLADRLTKAGVKRIGIEATGGYERGVTRHLQGAGFTVVTLQPLQVKAFAMLASQAGENRPDRRRAHRRLHPPAGRRQQDPARSALRRAGRPSDLHRADRGGYRPHQNAPGAHPRRTHAAPGRRRHQAAGEAARWRTQAPDWCSARARQPVAVVRMPEQGQVSREEAAAIAGLAPFVRKSGKREGEVHIGGGPSRRWRALYMAALPPAS